MSTAMIPTPGERLLLDRLRRSFTQHEAARHHGVTVDAYRRMESDRAKRRQIALASSGLSPREACLLHRRRAGVKQKELAAALGVSVLWVGKMERGTAPIGRLAKHWGVKA